MTVVLVIELPIRPRLDQLATPAHATVPVATTGANRFRIVLWTTPYFCDG